MWSTNKHLQHYYLRQGFIYVRTVALPTTHPGPCSSGQPSECLRRDLKSQGCSQPLTDSRNWIRRLV
jgi:hypothetical protein